jgi:hypothetical protein
MSKSKKAWVVAMAGLMPLVATAQSSGWSVVAGESAQVVAPDLPTGTFRDITDVIVGDTGAMQFGFRVSSPAALEGYWSQRGGQLTRYAQRSVAGATGPGRSGAEAGHVFLAINSGWGGAGADGQRAFLARAGDAAATLTASYGLWRWNGTANVEVARGSTDGGLGPGLGTNWVFPNSSGFASARMQHGGGMVISADVTSPTNEDSQVVLRHVPGQGNLPCLRTGAIETALAPGLTAGDSFFTFSAGIGRLSLDTEGRIHARLAATGSREGIWQICDGAPRAIAVNDEIGERGPDVGIATAEFSSFSSTPPQPAGGGDLMFFADWRVPPASGRTALFRHDGSANRGIAYNEPSGYFGPNWSTSTWRSFDTGSLSVARDYSAFVAGLDTPGGGDPVGLWRVRAGDRPELVALLGLTGEPYEPEPGRTWRSFDAVAVLSNGDIVLDASSNPNNTRDLWLLQQGQAPQRLLSIGQAINVPTPQGLVAAAVTGFDVPDGGAAYSNGSDSWIAADGTLLLPVNVANFGRVLVTRRLSVPNPDAVFGNGFE